jgi:O-methyltransferase
MAFKPIRFVKQLLAPKNETPAYPADFEPFHIEIIEKVRPYTMTSVERLFALIEAVKYVVHNNIEGSIVECGVWKGGSMMAVAETLKKLNATHYPLFLYDTYAGMTAPTDHDKAYNKESAADLLGKDLAIKEESVVWAFSTIEEVKANISKTQYPQNNIRFIEGDVLKTIPAADPGQIALLRLDTDWYESTKHEMEQLYPKLNKSGVLIIDDYGYWKGSRKAVDEYLEANNISIMLNRIDDTGRAAIKP